MRAVIGIIHSLDKVLKSTSYSGLSAVTNKNICRSLCDSCPEQYRVGILFLMIVAYASAIRLPIWYLVGNTYLLG